ncbi:hypothetical protein Dthio_PD2184 [Desulfonatronospira thiodismutans ASO3-1]|uniref:Thioredoxin domain-containing protein n=1 Tax=Desulfonatronospira thiodismutans ASO3-1 TaxID=555779 RepID=D6SPX7_9BACT|nr:hypothetical protein [Desulfonatronospira thiodismutans]EFI34803.1 hypothetical protein Dthio_PD2184 [Desulfonatronospira thiodismutans ASO3-1]
MKKPTKKSTIPALVLGGFLAYATIGDKVNSEYQNTTQQNAQVETAKTDYKASALENLTNALAPAKAHAGTNYQRPDDATLKEWMNQPVEETLAGTNYTKVNDHNYQREVKQSDQPVMVLFYNAQGEASAGLTALTKTLHEKFPEIKLCAYKLSDRNTTPRNVYNHVTSEYPVEKTPSLLFYEEKDFGSGTEKGHAFNGGIKNFDLLTDTIESFYEPIKRNMLD